MPNPPGIRTLDASFIEHIKQGHVPYRNDCKFCVRGSARRKQHRRVLCPGAWCLSVDSAGPYKCGLSETSKSQRYMIVGVLTVPILELQEKPEDQPEAGPPDEELGGALMMKNSLLMGKMRLTIPFHQRKLPKLELVKHHGMSL